MTEEPAKLDNKLPGSVSTEYGTRQRRFGAESITAGLEWLSAARRDDHWTDLDMFGGATDVWATACVLARLGEIPEGYFSYPLRQQIEKSLDWLEHARIAGSGWCGFYSGEPDAFTTSWAIQAMRSHHRSVPSSSLDMVLRCRQANGGFSAYPLDSPLDGPYNVSRPEITVAALRVLSIRDSAAEGFLGSRLRDDLLPAGAGRASWLYICSEVLDWESGVAPWSLLKRISRSIASCRVEEPYEQALLLRSLLRLRNQRAWEVGAALREMQLIDGSWPACAVLAPPSQVSGAVSPACFADTRTITTATALSALVMSESQPGLYFGSDLPRRLREC